MARRRRLGDLDGILVVDKPSGMTSHDVVQAVRRVLGESRVGHTGTLDPAATGVLVVCVGRATRLVQYLQAGTKTYAATMVLGVETDSQDADGAVVSTTVADHIDERTLCEALTRFQGPIEQIPPMVSAVKVDGERLHAKARRGETVERKARNVTIEHLVLDTFEPGRHPRASFLVTCSSGTYVRTLAHDVGKMLGVGGSLTALRRLANEPFHIDEAISLEDLEEVVAGGRVASRLVTPLEAVYRVLPCLDLDGDGELLQRLRHGAAVPAEVAATVPELAGPDGLFAVTAGTALIGIYQQTGHGMPATPQLVWAQPADVATLVQGSPR